MEFPHPSIPSSGCLSQSSHCLGQWFTRFSSWFTFKLSTIVENTQASPYQSSLYQKLKLRLLKILINSFEHKINPLKHNIDSIYLFKITAFSKTKKCNEKEHFFFFYIFANPSHVLLNRWHLNSHTRFYIQSVAVCSFWLKTVKELQPHTDMQLEKGGVFSYLL